MRISRTLSAIATAALALCGCTDVVGLGHGDPGRDPQASAHTPLIGSAPTPAASPPQVSSPVSPPSGAAAPSAAVTTAVGAVSAVSVTLADHAQQLAATDPRLSAAAVAAAVEHELQQYQLLVPGSPGPQATLAIRVEDFTTALASNAVVLGYTFRSAVLIGEVTVQGGAAASRPPFDVHARVRLTSRDAGANAASLGPLYTRFAQVVVADLRGVDAPSEPVPR